MKKNQGNLFLELGLDTQLNFLKFVSPSSENHSNMVGDLSRNFNSAFSKKTLSPKEASLISLCVACNEQNNNLIQLFSELSTANNSSNTEIAETLACASLMATNNVLFRFKHEINNPNYKSIPAGIRMSLKLKPTLGNELYELLSLTISSINGCTACMNEHENHAKLAGASEQKIFDAIRLGSIVRGLSVITTA